MPIHPIGEKNRKGGLGSPYSVRDYLAVNPEFGTFDDLKRFVARAHELGLKVILDWVANHTAWDNLLVKQHPEWFWPLDYNGKQCTCGGGCDWNDTYEQKRCWFTTYLPDWNFTVPEARAFSVQFHPEAAAGPHDTLHLFERFATQVKASAA